MLMGFYNYNPNIYNIKILIASPEKSPTSSQFLNRKNSGLTISAFCKQHNTKYNILAYYSWRKRLTEPEPSIMKKRQVVPLFLIPLDTSI